MKRNCKKTNQNKYRIEEVIIRKGDKLYVKWKGYYNSLTAVENKIPSVSNLVKKADHDTKISELGKKITDHKHDKCITTPEFNK